MSPPDLDRAADPDRAEEGPDAAAIRAAKNLLRKAIQLGRDIRPAEQRHADDAARFGMTAEHLPDPLPAAVACYLSSGSEPGTLQLIGWLAAHDVPVLLPVLSSPASSPRREPAWAVYEGPDALRQGVRGILEPTGAVLPAESLNTAELVLCPGLAANSDGQRLGRGGGWYDRALVYARRDAPTWVVLNDNEVLEAIPTDSWDLAVTAILTPTRFLECHPHPAR